MQQPFSNTACYCELAVKQPIFETSQSCVSTKVPLSHRFKSSPAIPGKLVAFAAAGYMMNAGHFSENLESSGDLNRPWESRGSQPSACFCGTFCTPQKVPIRSLAGNFRGSVNLESAHPNNDHTLTKLKPSQKENRGSANLDSARRNGGFPLTKLNPFKASFEVLKTSNQRTKTTNPHKQT